MDQDRFQFKLHEDLYSDEDDKDLVFTASLFSDDLYSVSFEGEAVFYYKEDVEQYIAEENWILI